MADFERLKVWQRAHQLALAAYRLTKPLPNSERFGLTDQIRRAAVAIPANIAEGHGRASSTEFRPFISIALGSLSELQALMLLARDLGYVAEAELTEFWDLAAEVGKMLSALIARLGSR
jgi:four helix bundle protein